MFGENSGMYMPVAPAQVGGYGGNEKIADLQRQLGEANSARLMETLGNRIVANNEAQTTALEQYLAPKANPAWIVQNPNCCGNQSPYGCGCSFN